MARDTVGRAHQLTYEHSATRQAQSVPKVPRHVCLSVRCVCTVSVSLCAYARYTILDRTCGRYAPSTYLLPTRYVILSCARRALQLYTLYIPLRV